ncbi:cytosolic carboxypeptidase-like protein 5 isoform X3 [Physella acuta]|uniref:cytosolic carboxypeptidase-like protein 5 isoform X3 n=1 Tax=Physella acuta TaxID=109671 RepID=UPI0027DB785A|nr:cytosolic carboxypeptidase-like protein 5 isoform X3 [Physella acuta]
MEIKIGGLCFTSNFDSGNLARVEKVLKPEEETENGTTAPAGSLYTGLGIEAKVDYEFNVWTKPDCEGTPYENPNRSWFYFGVRGWASSRVIKINIMNMNRQGKLYSQGLTPIVRIMPGKPKWERIRDRPSFENIDGQFILRFTYRFPDLKSGTAYFAFCYPWSYTESQSQLEELDKKFLHCQNYTPEVDPDNIYYHRELLCHTLDKLRVDLITISSCHGLTEHTEPRFDRNLFPDKDKPRCKRFVGKKVFVLSSRVHPGETPASHVFNGFLNFILREGDPRAQQLRQRFIFKLIPMLNPDGVVRGHYRTDPRGVNLNRVYLDPSPIMHPSIYAAKSLIIYHHVQEKEPCEGSVNNLNIQFPCEGGVNNVNIQFPGEGSVNNINIQFPSEGSVNSVNINFPSKEQVPTQLFQTGPHNMSGNFSDFTTTTQSQSSLDQPSEVINMSQALYEPFITLVDSLAVHSSDANQTQKITTDTLYNTEYGETQADIPCWPTHASSTNLPPLSSRRSVDAGDSGQPKYSTHSYQQFHQEHQLRTSLAELDKTKSHAPCEDSPALCSLQPIPKQNYKHNLELRSAVEGDVRTVLQPARSVSPVRGQYNQSNMMDSLTQGYPAVPVLVEPLNLAGLRDSESSVKHEKDAHLSSSDSSGISLFDPNENNGKYLEVKRVDSDLRLKLSSLNMSEEYHKHSALSLGVDTDDEDTQTDQLGNEGSEGEDDYDTSDVGDGSNAPHLRDPELLKIPPHASGIAMYIDLHGHASKRGCFIYGNYFENEEAQVDNMLYPKLVAMNTAHFDFTACNFSEKNMYQKDKRDGMSKEGSGRVAIYKAIGIIHSYTLECNYNTGRMVNPVPQAYGDEGRATPPPAASFPPKYTPLHFEDVGKALAIACLDLVDANPWSRVVMSEHSTLYGVREAVRRYLRGLRGQPKTTRVTAYKITNIKTSGPVTNQVRRASTSEIGTSSGNLRAKQVVEVSSRLYPRPHNAGSANAAHLKRELAPVREATRNPQPLLRRTSFTQAPTLRARAKNNISPVTLTMSAGADDQRTGHVQAAEPNLKCMETEGSLASQLLEVNPTVRAREESKVLLPKQIHKRPIPSRIPLPTGKSQFRLPASPIVDLAGNLRQGSRASQTWSGSASGRFTQSEGMLELEGVPKVPEPLKALNNPEGPSVKRSQISDNIKRRKKVNTLTRRKSNSVVSKNSSSVKGLKGNNLKSAAVVLTPRVSINTGLHRHPPSYNADHLIPIQSEREIIMKTSEYIPPRLHQIFWVDF